MIKVLLICDRKNWAYDSIAKALVKYNQDKKISLDIFYMKGNASSFRSISKDYDILFFLGWQLILEEKKRLFSNKPVYKKRFNYVEDERVLTGLHSYHAWDNLATLPDKEVLPPQALIETLKNFKGINAVSQRLTKLFKKVGLDECRYTPNGVDDELFRPIEDIGKEKDFIIVGFSGNRKHDWRKGIAEYIEPLKRYEWIKLKLAMPQGDYVPLEEMPRFYNEIDLYLCASSSEGFSLSVLEASACGRPIVSTRISGSEELIIDNYNGLFAKRDFNDIRKKIGSLYKNRDRLTEMGRNNRKEVEEKWSWKRRTKDWIDFIKKSNGID